MNASEEDIGGLRLLLRIREQYQDMRKRIDNRLGKKADGEDQDVDERPVEPGAAKAAEELADNAREQEAIVEKALKKALKRWPVYTEYLKGVKGVGPIMAATIIASIDIEKATTVSKIWQFAGMNPGQVRGLKREDHDDGTFDLIPTDTMVRGDRKAKGFVCPYNAKLKTALLGVLADGFIKAQAPYCMDYYYPRKTQLENSDRPVLERCGNGKEKTVAWKDATPMHRHMAARRYMVKMFLIDLHKVWREIEGLAVRPPYSVEKLGHVHGGASVA